VRYDAGHVTRNPDGDCRGTGGTPHSFRSLSVKRRPDSDGPFGKRGDRAMAASGHEERFPPLRLSGRCEFCEGTFAGTAGNDEDAPLPAVR
jgi:hypothetical protein